MQFKYLIGFISKTILELLQFFFHWSYVNWFLAVSYHLDNVKDLGYLKMSHVGNI